MEPNKLINVLLDSSTLKSNVCQLIEAEKFEQSIHLPNDVTLSLDGFIATFIDGVHFQAKWLFKESESETKPNSRQKTPTSKAKTQTNNVTPTSRVSPKKHASYIEKRQPPRVKLFDSPLRGENSPASSGFSSSTPKQFFNRSTNSPESSPLWPNSYSPSSHQNRTMSSPGSTHAYEDRSSRRLKISLGDFVIKDLKSPKGKNRRIKPTKVTPEATQLLPTDGPFALESPVSEKSCSIEEGLAAKMDSVMLDNLSEQGESETSNKNNTNNEEISVTGRLIGRQILKTVYDMKSVTNQESLDILAEIYGLILSKNACENIMMELYFLINLIVAVNNLENVKKFPPLDSHNNCAYFAVKTLIQIEQMVSFLASTTLGLLAAQPALAEFSPGLKTTLENLSRSKLNKSSNVIHVPAGGNVSFQCDTDNAENFVSNLNFASFRKQRDGLYNLLQLWEKSHNDNGFNFKNSMASKVRSILNIKDDPTNILHLARLFGNQLLASCAIQSGSLDEAGEEVLELLPTADRDRISRLQARLSEPRTSRGPVPHPDFPGRQLFFKEFIEACGPGMFNHFLKSCLVDELLKLNDFEFSSEGCDSFADDLTQKRYIECVSSTKLLAKFLAFSEFSPYYTDKPLPEQVLNLHCAMRQRVLPLFDLDCCLKDAVKNHRLVLTLPWIIAYLSLMDSTSVRLPVYAKTWQHLFWLRRNLPKYMTNFGRFMLQLDLGWLFQIVNLPELTEEALNFCEGVQDLDDIDVVNEVVLICVCPFLNELNALLTGSSAHTARHVRPTPTKPSGNPVKQLELRLEENFLQNQSQSTRRCIQFVAERVASCCIKDIANEILPSIRKTIIEEFLQHGQNPEKQISTFLKQWETQVNLSTNSQVLETCKMRCAQSLRGLLWKDVNEAVITNAIALATRQSFEKIRNWVQTNTLYDREKIKALLKTHDEIKETEQRADLLPECLNALRDVVVRINCGTFSESYLLSALDSTQMVITTGHLSMATERGILCMLVEILTEIANCPVDINSWERIADTIRLVNPKKQVSNPLERIFCARNLQNATKRLIQLPLFLVKENLITVKNAIKQARDCSSEDLTQELKNELLIVTNKLEQIDS